MIIRRFLAHQQRLLCPSTRIPTPTNSLSFRPSSQIYRPSLLLSPTRTTPSPLDPATGSHSRTSTGVYPSPSHRHFATGSSRSRMASDAGSDFDISAIGNDSEDFVPTPAKKTTKAAPVKKKATTASSAKPKATTAAKKKAPLTARKSNEADSIENDPAQTQEGDFSMSLIDVVEGSNGTNGTANAAPANGSKSASETYQKVSRRRYTHCVLKLTRHPPPPFPAFTTGARSQASRHVHWQRRAPYRYAVGL